MVSTLHTSFTKHSDTEKIQHLPQVTVYLLAQLSYGKYHNTAFRFVLTLKSLSITLN